MTVAINNLLVLLGVVVGYILLYLIPTFILSRVFILLFKKKYYFASNVLSLAICVIAYLSFFPGELMNPGRVAFLATIYFGSAQLIWLLRDIFNTQEQFKKMGGAKQIYKKVLTVSYVDNKKIRMICLLLSILFFLIALFFTNDVLVIIGLTYLPYLGGILYKQSLISKSVTK